jgi:hypothetical protein
LNGFAGKFSSVAGIQDATVLPQAAIQRLDLDGFSLPTAVAAAWQGSPLLARALQRGLGFFGVIFKVAARLYDLRETKIVSLHQSIQLCWLVRESPVLIYIGHGDNSSEAAESMDWTLAIHFCLEFLYAEGYCQFAADTVGQLFSSGFFDRLLLEVSRSFLQTIEFLWHHFRLHPIPRTQNLSIVDFQWEVFTEISRNILSFEGVIRKKLKKTLLSVHQKHLRS